VSAHLKAFYRNSETNLLASKPMIEVKICQMYPLNACFMDINNVGQISIPSIPNYCIITGLAVKESLKGWSFEEQAARDTSPILYTIPTKKKKLLKEIKTVSDMRKYCPNVEIDYIADEDSKYGPYKYYYVSLFFLHIEGYEKINPYLYDLRQTTHGQNELTFLRTKLTDLNTSPNKKR
jgi:hypothetical protein